MNESANFDYLFFGDEMVTIIFIIIEDIVQ
jgi:hypothetical protein